MRVLIACEFSGVVRDAFIKAGHDAYSCDMLTTEAPGPHYQCDVLSLLRDRQKASVDRNVAKGLAPLQRAIGKAEEAMKDHPNLAAGALREPVKVRQGNLLA